MHERKQKRQIAIQIRHISDSRRVHPHKRRPPLDQASYCIFTIVSSDIVKIEQYLQKNNEKVDDMNGDYVKILHQQHNLDNVLGNVVHQGGVAHQAFLIFCLEQNPIFSEGPVIDNTTYTAEDCDS